MNGYRSRERAYLALVPLLMAAGFAALLAYALLTVILPVVRAIP